MISLNVLGMPTPDTTALIDWITAAKPRYVLVMDNLDLAARVAMTGAQVIYRKYRDDDARLPEATKPADFLASVADVPKSYIVQAGNEPGGDQALLAAWSAALIRQAEQVGRRVAVGNWSVGNPDEEFIQTGRYDLILQALADTGGRHILSQHEYFHNAPAAEPYFVGRYRHFLRRADALGIRRPIVAITEHGRDLGGGPNDGWRGQGWSEADYARRLAEAQTVYNADGVCAAQTDKKGRLRCWWCGKPIEGAPHVDHKLALAAGGTNGPENLCYACARCNLSKQTKSPAEFAGRLL